MLTANGSPSQLWAGDQVWQGFAIDQAMRGATYWSRYAKAQWEKFMHNTLSENGLDPVAIIGAPDYSDMWNTDD